MKKKYMKPEVEKILFTFERIMLDPNDPVLFTRLCGIHRRGWYNAEGI